LEILIVSEVCFTNARLRRSLSLGNLGKKHGQNEKLKFAFCLVAKLQTPCGAGACVASYDNMKELK